MAGLQVFVSHASADRAVAGELHGWLAAAGHDVFLDTHPADGISPGEEWEGALHERLRRSDVVVCVMTTAYLASTWCTAEIAIARSRGSAILPICAEAGVRHPLVASLHALDLTADPTGARTAVIAALDRIGGAGRRGWPDDRSPFPGLRAFETDEHLAFFGREVDVDRIAERLRSATERAENAALIVVGPSGCGKSSTVRAGVLPRMADDPGWRALPPISPGSDPVEELCAAMTTAGTAAGLDWSLPTVRDRVEEGELGRLVGELLLAVPGRPRQHLLIVVDQLEQLLTISPAAARARFAQVLAPTLTGHVRLLATLRPEFLDRLLSSPELAALPTAVHSMSPLGRSALRLVIEGPARLWRLTVPEELVATLVDDTGSGTALPLLAFTLSRLVEHVGPGGELSTATYRELGGVAGALAARADEALAAAAEAGDLTPDEVLAALLNLVTVDADGRSSQRPTALADLPEPAVTALTVFVGRRLLVTSTSTDGRAVVAVAHETLLSAWRPLREAIASTAAALRARSAIEDAAGEWTDHQRSGNRLWETGRLAAALADVGMRRRALHAAPQRSRPLVHLNPAARTFLDASVRRDVLLRSRLVAVLSALLLSSTVLAAVVVDSNTKLDAQLSSANAEILAAAAQTRRESDPTFAARMALSAYRSDQQSPAALDVLLDAYLGLRSAEKVLDGLTDQAIDTVRASADGHRVLVTHQGGATLITDPLGPGRTTWTVPGLPDDGVVKLTAGGHWLIGGTGDDVLIWDAVARTGPELLLSVSVPAGDDRPLRLVASPDDTRFAVLAPDPTGPGQRIGLWDLATRQQLATPPGLLDGGTVRDITFTTDPTRIVVDQPDDPAGTRSRLTTRSLADGSSGPVLFDGDRKQQHMLLVAGGLLVTCQETPDPFDSDQLAVVDTATTTPGPSVPLLNQLGCGTLSVELTAGGTHLLRQARTVDPDGVLGTARLTDFTGRSFEFALPTDDSTAAFDQERNDTVAALPGPDGSPRLLAARGPALLVLRPLASPLEAVSPASGATRLSDDGRYLVVETSRELIVADPRTGVVLSRVEVPTGRLGRITAVTDEAVTAFQRDGSWFLTRYALPALDVIASYELPGSADFSAARMDQVSFVISDGRLVTTVAGTLAVRDLLTSTPLGDPVRPVSDEAEAAGLGKAVVEVRPGRPDQVAVVTPEQPVRIWSLGERRTVATIPARPIGEDHIRTAVFAEDGDLLAVLTGDRTIEVWDVDSGSRVHTVPYTPEAAELVGFIEDRYVISRSVRGLLQIWDLVRGVPSGSMQLGGGQSAASISTDGTALTVDGVGAMPLALPLSPEVWARELCRALPGQYPPREQRALPAGATVLPPCPA